MKQINIITGQKINDITKNVLEELRYNINILSCENIVITPDRYSLNVEKMIFEQFNICSVINTNVMGINKLAKKFIEDSNLGVVYCSELESQLLIRRAIQKEKNNFLCFSKNISPALCSEVSKTIAQLKSCLISTKDFFESYNGDDIGLKNKFHDIQLIYESYENMLAGKLDSAQTLTIFSKLIENTSAYENVNFYFVGFDSMTTQGIEILKILSKVSKSVTIGTIKSDSNKSRLIFDEELYKCVVAISKENSIKVVEKNYNTEFHDERDLLFQNVFSSQKKLIGESNDYVKVTETNDVYDECEFVAKQIKWLVGQENVKYSQIQICANPKYNELLSNIFAQFEIPNFIDSNETLTNTTLSNFILSILKMQSEPYEQYNLLSFLQSDFYKISKDDLYRISNIIKQYDIKPLNISKLKEYFDISSLEKIIEQLRICTTVNEYCNVINNIFGDFDVENELNKMVYEFHQKGFLKLEKVYGQVFDKFRNLLNKLNELVGEEKIDCFSFVELLESGINDIEIKSIPMPLDGVYIGDVSKTFFSNSDILFIVGANEGDLPITINDCGIISDSDIKTISDKVDINPTIKIINRRAKYKLFDLLTTANKKLYISYQKFTSEGKLNFCSNFVVDIQNSYNNFVLHETCLDNIYESEGNLKDKILFNNPNCYIANTNLNSNMLIAPILKKVLIQNNQFKNYNKINKVNITNVNDLYFEDDKTKISQIESYYSCPFSHFLKYGLKLKENPSSEIKANDFGNILHKVAEIFVENNKNKLGQMTKIEIENEVGKIFQTISKNEKFYVLNLKENDFTVTLLKNESCRLCSFINYEQSLSNFKIEKSEMYFGKENNVIVNADKKNYYISGIVDRVDVYDNYFRIIDYKSGSNAKGEANFGSLYYGKKLQIFVYVKAVEKCCNKKVFGAFYLPISNKYEEQNEDSYKMLGFYIDEPSLAFNCDKTLSFENPKSKIFECSLSTSKDSIKNGVLKLKGNKCLSPKVFENMIDYALELSKKAIEEINSGYIESSPFKDACKFCPFFAVCDIFEKNRIRKPDDTRINKKTFDGGINGQN